MSEEWKPINRGAFRTLKDSFSPELRATYTRNAPGDEFGVGDYWLTEWTLSDGRVIRSINNDGTWEYAEREPSEEGNES